MNHRLRPPCWAIISCVIFSGIALAQDTPEKEAADAAAPEAPQPQPADLPVGPFNDPTFSLEVVKLNGVVIQNGPLSEIKASPGDTMTLEIFMRNWSPNGEKLRAYQVSVERSGYSSGHAGTIRAIGYEETTEKGLENKENCFVDGNDPRFVFLGLQKFAITDSVTPSHRWLGALVDMAQARVSAQNGKKYYCGTMKVKVSENARGPFTLHLSHQPWASTMRDPKNNPIPNVSFEPLQINVGPRELRILSSDPPTGAIDARVAGGWKRILMRHNGAAAASTAADFRVEDGTPNPPRITSLELVGSLITLTLDRGITRGVWTEITHIPSGTGTRIAYLPGDVDNNGSTDTEDVTARMNRRGTTGDLPMYRADINRNGLPGVDDTLELIDLLNEPAAYRAKIHGDH